MSTQLITVGPSSRSGGCRDDLERPSIRGGMTSASFVGHRIESVGPVRPSAAEPGVAVSCDLMDTGRLASTPRILGSNLRPPRRLRPLGRRRRREGEAAMIPNRRRTDRRAARRGAVEDKPSAEPTPNASMHAGVAMSARKNRSISRSRTRILTHRDDADHDDDPAKITGQTVAPPVRRDDKRLAPRSCRTANRRGGIGTPRGQARRALVRFDSRRVR